MADANGFYYGHVLYDLVCSGNITQDKKPLCLLEKVFT